MKSFITLSLIFIALSGLTQSDSSVLEDSTSVFYILDETWKPKDPLRFSTDDSPNYLQLEGGYAVICSRSRNNTLFIEGEIDALEVYHENGDKITSFFIRGRGRTIGKLLSVEIVEKDNGEIIIHVFRKLGEYDTYYSAHSASQAEINEIIQYWKE